MILGWYKRHDWPMEWEKARRETLIRAVGQLPGASRLCEAEKEGKALFIWQQVDVARQIAHNCFRPASQKVSDDELRKLSDLCDKLAIHIDGLHAPAIAALEQEGFCASDFAEKLRDVKEFSRFAFGCVEGEDVRGRKPEIGAAHVSEIAGKVYREITGKIPTLTTDTATGTVSGVWPDFLQTIFDAAYIKASVASQARSTSEKMRAENLR